MSSFYERPILNSPYRAPELHHPLDPNGQPLDLRSQSATSMAEWGGRQYPRRVYTARGVARVPSFLNTPERNPDLFRIAMKIATGSRKITAMLIAWQAVIQQ